MPQISKQVIGCLRSASKLLVPNIAGWAGVCQPLATGSDMTVLGSQLHMEYPDLRKCLNWGLGHLFE